jgi:oligopeptide transport system ATP-binding protein
MRPVLQVKDLLVRFHTMDGIVHAVNGVSFDLHERETLAIVGESGCGKSVTMMTLLGLIPQPPARIEGGQALLYDGFSEVDLLTLPESDMRRVRGGSVGFIFQDPMTSLNPVLTVGQQISESMVEHLGIGEREARKRTADILGYVGIAGAAQRLDDFPHQFSGGMRQRVMIAMAIACKPKVLIADEPTTALDVTVQAQIVDLVARLREEMSMSVIWITHDLGVVAGLADRVIVMYAGRVAENALVDELYEQPQHPYTVGLLGALPAMNSEGAKRLVNIQGSPPDLFNRPTHCSYAFRCPHAFDTCWQTIPPLEAVRPNHGVACYFDVTQGRARNGI